MSRMWILRSGGSMTADQIRLNAEVNSFLQKGYLLELKMKDQPEAVRSIRRITSVTAHNFILANGLDIALKQFWAERKTI